MKVLCSQEVVSPHLCGVVPCQITAKASSPQVPGFVLCLWLQKGVRGNMAWSKPIDFYALSCGSFRKPAQNLIEIAQRKSQFHSPHIHGQRAHSSESHHYRQETRSLSTRSFDRRP